MLDTRITFWQPHTALYAFLVYILSVNRVVSQINKPTVKTPLNAELK
jgi:hypothetical protein